MDHDIIRAGSSCLAVRHPPPPATHPLQSPTKPPKPQHTSNITGVQIPPASLCMTRHAPFFQDICETEAAFEWGSIRGEGLYNRSCCFLHPVLGEMVAVTVTCQDSIRLVYKPPAPSSSSPTQGASPNAEWVYSTCPVPIKRPACISAVSIEPLRTELL
jgi:hypothetical protein